MSQPSNTSKFTCGVEQRISHFAPGDVRHTKMPRSTPGSKSGAPTYASVSVTMPAGGFTFDGPRNTRALSGKPRYRNTARAVSAFDGTVRPSTPVSA